MAYAAVKTAVGLAGALPTFYKSFEGLLLGENKSSLFNAATAAENYMSKFTTSSTSEAGQGSLFNYEQIQFMLPKIIT